MPYCRTISRLHRTISKLFLICGELFLSRVCDMTCGEMWGTSQITVFLLVSRTLAGQSPQVFAQSSRLQTQPVSCSQNRGCVMFCMDLRCCSMMRFRPICSMRHGLQIRCFQPEQGLSRFRLHIVSRPQDSDQAEAPFAQC